MDSIIDQMMTVAEYIGWETKELRPVSLNYQKGGNMDISKYIWMLRKILNMTFWEDVNVYDVSITCLADPAMVNR